MALFRLFAWLLFVVSFFRVKIFRGGKWIKRNGTNHPAYKYKLPFLSRYVSQTKKWKRRNNVTRTHEKKRHANKRKDITQKDEITNQETTLRRHGKRRNNAMPRDEITSRKMTNIRHAKRQKDATRKDEKTPQEKTK